MNKSLMTGLVIGAVVAVGAGATAGLKMVNSKGPQYAQVLKVTPLTKTIQTPRQECHDETVTHQAPVKDQHQIMGTVAGAVIVIGLETYLAQLGAWVTVVQGAIFVLCVLAFRRGVVGELARLLKKPL